MSEANQVCPGGVTKSPPTTALDQMLSTLSSGEPEDKHFLNHECEIILECKICRNLFRVMGSFLNHKKVHCLQYVVSFTLPLQVSKSNEEKSDKDNSTTTITTTTEKPQLPPPSTPPAVAAAAAEVTLVKDSQKTDQTKKSLTAKSSSKSKETDKESLSDKNQTKSPTTTVRVTASVENSDTMKLRSPRKTDNSISKTDDSQTMKKDASPSKKDKKDSKQPKKGDISGHKESSSKKRDVSNQKKEVADLHKKSDSSSHKKSDVFSTPKKNDGSGQRREESPRKESSRKESPRKQSSKKESSSVSSKRDRKEDASSKKGDSSSHKKDDSTKKETHKKEESSIPFRIGNKDSSSHKKEESSVLSQKGDKDSSIPFKKEDKESSSQKKEGSSVPFKKGDKSKKEESSTFKRGESSNQKKEESSAVSKKVNDNSSVLKKEDSTVQKKETNSSAKQVDSVSQKKTGAQPPLKKQKTEDSHSSPTKKFKEEPREKMNSSKTTTTTTTVASGLPAVTLTPILSLPSIVPTPAPVTTTSTLAPLTLSPAPTLGLATASSSAPLPAPSPIPVSTTASAPAPASTSALAPTSTLASTPKPTPTRASTSALAAASAPTFASTPTPTTSSGPTTTPSAVATITTPSAVATITTPTAVATTTAPSSSVATTITPSDPVATTIAPAPVATAIMPSAPVAPTTTPSAPTTTTSIATTTALVATTTTPSAPMVTLSATTTTLSAPVATTTTTSAPVATTTTTSAPVATTTTTSSPVATTTISSSPVATTTTSTPIPTTSTPTPLITSSTITVPSTDIKEMSPTDQDMVLVHTVTKPASTENKTDEPPVLTPEKVVSSEAVELPNQKTDASDTLNPLIAGVLDAYQRYKDKNQPLPEMTEGMEKQNRDETPANITVTATIAKPVSSTETVPSDIDLSELPEVATNNTVENKHVKEEKVSVESENKNQSLNDNDLDKDLDDPERYELRNRLRCPDCGLELNNMSKLAQHMSKHLANAKGHFVCPICQKETRLETFSELILHLRDPHFLKDKQLLPMWRNLMKNCWVDEKDMSATFPVIEAVKRSERSKDNEVPEKNYKCPYCKKKPKILRFFSGLIGHLRSEHGLKRCQLQKMKAKLRKTSVVEVKHKRYKKKCMLFKCSFCFKTFTKKSTIKLHVKSCRKRTETKVKDNNSKRKPRGRPKTFTKIVAFKTIGKKTSIGDNSVAMSTVGSEVAKEQSEHHVIGIPPEGNQSSNISTAHNTSKLSNRPLSASNKDSKVDLNYSFSPNIMQPVKLETYWVSKAPGKPSECIKSTVTNLEKMCTNTSKMFKSSDLSKIGNFQCYSCNRYFSIRKHFERHVQLCNHNRKIEEISDFQTLQCLECNQSFSYLQHLKRHAAKHLGLDRFKCKICNFSSYYWSDTKYHLASHKGVTLEHPEYYIHNMTTDYDQLKSDNTNELNKSPAKAWDTTRTVLKRVAETSPLVSSGSASSSPGVVKTLVLTEQDGMLKVVSDPNQIAKMVTQQQGFPPLKRLRISADASQAPAIIKALPDIQKSVLSPGLKIEKRESTLMTKNLPSPTLSDPTPTTEAFEPAVDPDKQHITWVRKPLKDPDAQPFTWDDDEEEGAENSSTMPSKNDSVSTASNLTCTTSTSTSSTASISAATENVQSSSIENVHSEDNKLAIAMSSISENKSLADKPVSENFSEPPILEKEVPIVKKSPGGEKEKEDLQMPRISVSDIDASDTPKLQGSVMTFMFNENNEIFTISSEDKSGGSSSSSSSKSIGISPIPHHTMVSRKDFFSVSHPSSSTSSTSTPISMSSYKSPISTAKLMNKPKTYWDLQHKNTLRRLPNRGLVSTSNLSFPSASRRVTKMSTELPVTIRVASPVTSTSLKGSTTSPSSSSSSSSSTGREK